GDRIDASDDPGANEHGALVAHHHGARAGNPAKPDLGLEARGQLDLVERQFVDRRRDRRSWNSFYIWILFALCRSGLIEATVPGKLRKSRTETERKPSRQHGG